MRFLLVISICFCLANSIALGQEADSSKSSAPAPQKQTTPQTAPQRTAPPRNASPQTTPPQPTPPQPAPLQTAPLQPAPLQPAPPQTAPPQTARPADDLSLDANRSFDFGDSDNSPYSRASDPQSSIASNSEFRGASPQMMGDFGGGSTILKIHNNLFGPNFPGAPLTVQIPFAGGSRRIKAGENNQVQPLNRVYGTFNYFDNAIVSGGPGSPVQSSGLSQYTMGIEKTFFENFSIDVRMPLVGIIDYTAIVDTPTSRTAAQVTTSGVGNLSTSFKALLLQMGQTSISSGLQLSIPTGSDARISFGRGTIPPSQNLILGDIVVKNQALHLMPFVGVYREFQTSWWLQAFTQVDVPTSGNDVRVDGQFFGRINEQTLLYSDVSVGKWLYRNRGRGLTGIASILELHYTSSLNDADTLFTVDPPENRLDVLNLTAGLQVEFSQKLRVNVSGVVPLREREFDGSQPDFPKRQEDRFFDGELSLQINRFF